MLSLLRSRQPSFFDHFSRHAAVIVDAAGTLVEVCAGRVPVARGAARILELEHEADFIAHACFDALRRKFFVPLDREMMHDLISRLDDVIDAIEAGAARLSLYEIASAAPAAPFGELLARAARELQLAVGELRDPRRFPTMLERVRAIGRIEIDGDRALRHAMAALLRAGHEPLHIIKWKEIYEDLEDAVDRCQDAANLLEGIAIEEG